MKTIYRILAYLIESGRLPHPASIGVLYADTRLELPNLQAAAMDMLAVLRSRGWETTIVLPELDKRFFLMMFGRGIPPSHSGFRWCTGVLKVNPMTDGMRSMKHATEKLLLITGMRIGESANRDKRISLACGKDGGECGQGWYEETTPAEVADVLSPILHWRTCHVWDWLMLRRKQHGFDCSAVAEVYDQDAEGSANEVLARTGCLSCPVASRDLVLERTVRKPEWAYLSPLLGLRPLYEKLSEPHNRLQKNAERKKDGTLSSRPMRMGPLIMQAREMGLRVVLEIQASVNRVARKNGRPEVSLINDEEHCRIRELIALNTWPDKWDGTEPVGDAMLPETRRDGTILPLLFGH